MDPSELLDKLKQSTQALQVLLLKVSSDVGFSEDTLEEELPKLSFILEQRGKLVSELLDLLKVVKGEQQHNIAQALHDTTMLDQQLIETALTKKESVRKVIVKMNKAPKSISSYTNNK
ncbi:hypothetical protein PSECIP111854_01887 [Pseudoalteromonas sp. CIP111854]|uniref:Uncharacterized protein n=1 Tax=Pseudoalteromonas holothuriae TaxID=2963714 RepID=A0A9W4VUY4_9GAMM|nr:hypothetical protein [Pseudoalteromonas sp. CIP111854]CAH9056900.1 hypothetical protein PSECIP111854_01887 [Pseudoalteromonas sp. CIP111854]